MQTAPQLLLVHVQVSNTQGPNEHEVITQSLLSGEKVIERIVTIQPQMSNFTQSR